MKCIHRKYGDLLGVNKDQKLSAFKTMTQAQPRKGVTARIRDWIRPIAERFITTYMPNVYRDQARLRTDVVAGPTLTFKVGDTVQKDFHGVTWIGTIVSTSDGLSC